MNIRNSFGRGLAALLCSVMLLASVGWATGQERGGVLTASITNEPISLDPILGNSPSVDSQVLHQIFDTLVRFSPDGPIEPFLAESYEFADDGMSLTFTLREGVTFHDGTRVDAEAVVYNLRRLIAPDVASLFTSGVADVDSVEAVDPLTVRVNLKQPSAVVLSAYAGAAGMIASPKALEEMGEDFGAAPVGSGPFRFQSRQAGTSLTLTRNEDYWREGADGQPLPYLDGINFRWITQNAVKMIELESGNVGLVDDIQSEDFGRVDSDPRFDLIDAGGISHWIAFNVTKPPFDDIRTRQAIYFAINREAVKEIIAGQFGQIIPTLVHPSEFVFDDSIDIYGYDPAKAQALLTEAGYGPQNPLRFNLSMIQREPDNSVAQIIQAQLAEVGISLNIQQLERQAFIDEWRGSRHDAGLARVDLPRGDPDQSFYPFFGRNAAQRTGEGDPTLFELIDKGRITLDQAERKQVYVDAQKRLLEIAHYVWIFMRESKHASTSELENLAISPVKTWYLDEAWLDR